MDSWRERNGQGSRGQRDPSLQPPNQPSADQSQLRPPRELYESEFFGQSKGSFTGALRDRIGRFELVDGGTLFLDEIGEIPLDMQAKLFGVLQERETFETRLLASDLDRR